MKKKMFIPIISRKRFYPKENENNILDRTSRTKLLEHCELSIVALFESTKYKIRQKMTHSANKISLSHGNK